VETINLSFSKYECVVHKLGETSRGTKGFGSSDNKSNN
jgi:dUTPase